jgi:outer membrane lipase/esterase
MTAGLAVNYTNYDGTYDDGGGFDKHIFGPLLYASFLPFEGAFTNVVLGYARQENRNNRLASASSTFGATVRGHTSADYSENQYTAGVLAGYDRPIGTILIGPRLGLAFSHEAFENFKEDGNTGLELQYHNLNQTSLQSSLGVQASVGLETPYGLVVPQAVVAWVHEYANDDRNIDARLVEAPAGPSFTFQREPPARDWATIGLGISALLPNGLQPFAQFATMQGNDNFVSYGGTVGLRKEF